MNKQKKLLLLLGVLVLASALTLAVVKQEDRKEKIKNTPATVLEWSAIDSVSWERDGISLAFEKQDGSWVYPEDTAFPVDQEKMESLLEQFAALGASFTIEDVEDYGQYGLTKPVCTITLTQEGETKVLKLGDYSRMDSQRYATFGDGLVYLLSQDPMDQFDTDLSGLIRQDTVPDFGTVEQIQVSGGQTDGYVRKEDGQSLCDEDLYFRQSDGEPLDTDLVNAYVKSLKNLTLTDYVTYNATEQALEDCLLADPAQTVTLTYTPEDGQTETFTLHLSKEPDPSEDVTGQAYARVGDSPILYRISAGDYEALTACGYDDLRHRQVFPADFDQADSVSVILDGETATLEYRKDQKDTEDGWYLGDTQVDLTQVQTALENLTAETFTTAAPTGKQELCLTVHLDREGTDEITVALYRLDGTQVLAQTDGKSLCYLPRTQAVALIEALNAILLG